MEHALQALAASKVEEVVVLARRGPAEAAYTTPELLSLVHHPDLDLSVEDVDGLELGAANTKVDIVRRIHAGEFDKGGRARRRVVLRYLASPVSVLGDDTVTGLLIENNRLGPSGVIGTNKSCAQQTIDLVLEDYRSGRRPEPNASHQALADRLPHALGLAAWERIDAHERARGRAQGRPRQKVADHEHLVAIGRGAPA